jgi:hypothetical protein
MQQTILNALEEYNLCVTDKDEYVPYTRSRTRKSSNATPALDSEVKSSLSAHFSRAGSAMKSRKRPAKRKPPVPMAPASAKQTPDLPDGFKIRSYSPAKRVSRTSIYAPRRGLSSVTKSSLEISSSKSLIKSPDIEVTGSKVK